MVSKTAELHAARIYKEAREVAEKICKLECSEELEEFGPRILEIMKGVSVDAFWMLDEKAGRFNYLNDADHRYSLLNGRFYMLRRVRNDCHTATNFGKQLFDNLVS